MSKVLNVFYGADRLPYKDQERQVHYPMVGNSFAGASLVDEIRFYAKDLGTENNVFVGIAKRPDGQRGYQVLTYGYDTELNEPYWTFNVSGWFTEKVGNVFVSLNVYQGGVDIEVDEDSGLAIVSGTPIIQATGSVVLSINYAPVMDNGYGAVPTIDVQEALSLVGSKVDTDYLTANYYNNTTIDGKLLLKADLSYVNGFVKTLEVAMDSSTYVLTFTCKDGTGTTISTQSIDLPLESVVVSGEYDSDTKSIILTLQNGNTITIPVSDLVDGLVDTTTFETAIQGIEDSLDTKANKSETYNRDYIDGKLDLKADKTTTTSLQNQINNLNYRLTVVEEAIIGIDTLTFTALSYSAIPNVSDNLYPIIQSGGLDTKEVNGNSFVHTQLVQNGNFVDASGWDYAAGTIEVSQNVFKATLVSATNSQSLYRTCNIIPNHKYLSVCDFRCSRENGLVRIAVGAGNYIASSVSANTWTKISGVITPATSNNYIYFYTTPASTLQVGDIVEFSNFQLFNLTKDFGAGNEPTTYDQAVSMYASKGIDITNYVAYTQGTLIDSKPVKLVSKDSEDNVIHEYPITTEVLRSAGSVQDSAVSKKVGSVDLGTLTWYYDTNQQIFYTSGLSSLIKTITDTGVVGNLLCSKYQKSNLFDTLPSQGKDNLIATYNGNVYVKDTSAGTDAVTFKTAMSGVILNYELATPAEQTATLPTDIEIEKGGSLEVVYDNGYTTPADFVFDCAVYKPLE